MSHPIPGDPDPYLVWSNEHLAWWGPGQHGYSRGLNDAGRYSRAEAIDICSRAMMTAVQIGMISEIPVRLVDLRRALAGGIVPQVILDGKDRR